MWWASPESDTKVEEKAVAGAMKAVAAAAANSSFIQFPVNNESVLIQYKVPASAQLTLR
jgi:hypothetical protein